MNYAEIKSHFKIKEDNGNRVKAICPAHPDKEASLSIKYDTEQSKTLIYCHAGCDNHDVLDRVGLKLTDLFDKPLEKDKGKTNIDKIYKYRDPAGIVVFEKIRFKPKKFSQRRESAGAVLWGLEAGRYYETYPGSGEYSMKQREGAESREFEGIEPVLYNLPELLQAVKDKKDIFIVEGEKDCDNLTSWGLVATCNFDGASMSKQKPKWRERYNKYFVGAKVIIMADNDDSGRAHAQFIAENLKGVAEYVKCVKLPDLDEKGDFSDWQAQGHSIQELIAIVDSTEDWNPVLQPDHVDLVHYNFSDVGNAERLIAMYSKIVRYKPGWKNPWLIWSGKHWKIDHENKIEVLARNVIKELQQQGNDIEETEDTKKLKENVQKFVLRSENDGRLRAMVNQARSHAGLIAKNMNKHDYLINYKNGTLNMLTGELQTHNRQDHITRLVDVVYDPEASCPNWTAFIDKIFLGDKDLITYIQKSIGYSMTGNADLQCFYICHGQGSNGKGTFMKTIGRLMGDYYGILKGSSLMEKMGDEGARGDLAKLEDKFFVLVNELEDSKGFDEALVKSLSSGADEAVPVRRMYEEEFDLRPRFKMWMTTNKLPKIKGMDTGIWRRVRKIPFLYNFENDENKDENFFEDKLIPEMSGILNWALEGCLMWQREGMQLPDVVKMANDEYKQDMDSIGRFLAECTVSFESTRTKRADLYDVYCEWCKENKEYTLSSIKLNRKLTDRGLQIQLIRGIYYWQQLGLANRDEEDPSLNGLAYLEPDNVINPFIQGNFYDREGER